MLARTSPWLLTFSCNTRNLLHLMDEQTRAQLSPGTRVKVTQQIAGRYYAWPTEVVGTVVSYQQKPTGSWYAHSRNDKLWLDRLTIRKDDGEITTLNLDEYSAIEPVGGAQVEEV
jgi:hypothetical protein